MVTSQLDTSTVWETSFRMPSSYLFQSRISNQGSKMWPWGCQTALRLWAELAGHFQATMLSTPYLFSSLLDLLMRISSQGSSNVLLNVSHLHICDIPRVRCLIFGLADALSSGIITTLCTIRKPFVWHRDGNISASVKSDDNPTKNSDYGAGIWVKVHSMGGKRWMYI